VVWGHQRLKKLHLTPALDQENKNPHYGIGSVGNEKSAGKSIKGGTKFSRRWEREEGKVRIILRGGERNTTKGMAGKWHAGIPEGKKDRLEKRNDKVDTQPLPGHGGGGTLVQGNARVEVRPNMKEYSGQKRKRGEMELKKLKGWAEISPGEKNAMKFATYKEKALGGSEGGSNYGGS